MSKKKKNDGRSTDLDLNWLTSTLGPDWETWRGFASRWIKTQTKATNEKLKALISFFRKYLPAHAPYAVDVPLIFKGQNGHLVSSAEFVEFRESRGAKCRADSIRCANNIVEFIDFVIAQEYSEPNDHGVRMPLVLNPMRKEKYQLSRLETVHNPLPYRYIKELRQIVCPYPSGSVRPWEGVHFRDWKWAQSLNSGVGSGQSGEWYEVDQEQIDKSDPDCVWRSKEVARNNKQITILQIWSPVVAMALFVKLHLPLRTYQIRMLDSGEADTWRFQNGSWVKNSHSFSLGSERRPYARGIFNLQLDTMTGSYSTGLYINTNKTADQNKDEIERGYRIPWQHEELLYWLEKLRNWQEKYNPIVEPTSWSTFEKKHIGTLKSAATLAQMGETCFLFRNASAKDTVDRTKPVSDQPAARQWYRLLLALEDKLYDKGVRLENGDRLCLVHKYPDGTKLQAKVKAYFPLHSMRVSLITAYTMDTELPLPVISKLLAGHSRLLMTLYYNKITPAVMAEKMEVAHAQLDQREDASIKAFLADASMEQIQCKTVFHSADSIQAALANRNPIGWEDRAHGLCLMGGNTVKSDEVGTLGGCWNGGSILKNAKAAQNRIYGSVPHGPENCVRCRWFITEARYLPALNAHFNQISYKANAAVNRANEIETELDDLKDEQYFAEEENRPFTKQQKLQELQRRYERQKVKASNYTEDYIATFNLIQRIMEIEEERSAQDSKDKLVAVGNQEDVSLAIQFIETESELLHLSVLCDDAEFIADLEDDLLETPALAKRSQALNRMLMDKGMRPIYLEMDEKQQLVAGNALMRYMAKIADPEGKLEGFRKAASYIEAAEYLQDANLLEQALDASKVQPLPLKSLESVPLLETV
jgi:hypothetical protein